MKNLNKLAKLSEEHGLSSYVSLMNGENLVELNHDGYPFKVRQLPGETLGRMVGRAVDYLEKKIEDSNKPEDKVTIKIAIRLDQQVGERWIEHQTTCPINYTAFHTHAREAMKIAYDATGKNPSAFTGWYDRVVVLIWTHDGVVVELRIARDNKDPDSWNTREDYRFGNGVTARFTNRTKHSPTPYLVGLFIANALDIAEKLAERDNPATI